MCSQSIKVTLNEYNNNHTAFNENNERIIMKRIPKEIVIQKRRRRDQYDCLVNDYALYVVCLLKSAGQLYFELFGDQLNF